MFLFNILISTLFACRFGAVEIHISRLGSFKTSCNISLEKQCDGLSFPKDWLEKSEFCWLVSEMNTAKILNC